MHDKFAPRLKRANFKLRVGTRTRMKGTLINNPQHWRDRAEEARINAEQIGDPESKRMMLEIAEGYMRLAERAERRLRESGQSG